MRSKLTQWIMLMIHGSKSIAQSWNVDNFFAFAFLHMQVKWFSLFIAENQPKSHYLWVIEMILPLEYTVNDFTSVPFQRIPVIWCHTVFRFELSTRPKVSEELYNFLLRRAQPNPNPNYCGCLVWCQTRKYQKILNVHFSYPTA